MIHLHDAEQHELSQWPNEDEDGETSADVQARLLRDRPRRRRRATKGCFGRRSIRRPSWRSCCALTRYLGLLMLLWILVTFLFRPSYVSIPRHYTQMRALAKSGRPVNENNIRVFIAASIYDPRGDLLDGKWGQNVRDLVRLLGNNNTFVSVYENAGGDLAQSGLQSFRDQLPCNGSIVYDHDFDMEQIPRIRVGDRVRRIVYLAEMRNRALAPFEAVGHFDRLFFLNDVYFDPVQAAQLILLTNTDDSGQAHYGAACAMDFINPVKFYDTFATRDTDGYSMGLPIYPWFSGAGSARSRSAVFQQQDAVSVKSCWGGMVSFDAKPFTGKTPVRFRASERLYREASECCLVYADLASEDTFVNPFVRVAYDPFTLSWIPFFKRFERLLSIPQRAINILVGLPWHNPHRLVPSESIHGDAAGGFCEIDGLQVLNEHQAGWETLTQDGRG